MRRARKSTSGVPLVDPPPSSELVDEQPDRVSAATSPIAQHVRSRWALPSYADQYVWCVVSTSTTLPWPVDPRAVAILERFVRDVARRLPGLLVEVHPTGSALTDDWQAAHSDVDAVFVVRRPVTAEDADQLIEAHAATQGANCVDGVYLTADQCAAGPDHTAEAPQAVHGVFARTKAGGQLNWVTWRERSTAPHGVADDGGAISWQEPAGGFTQFAELAQFCKDNLSTYWSGVVDQWQSALDTGQLTDDEVDTYSVVWTVLGPGRLIVTIETGEVVSKTASGQFSAERWPEYSGLIERAMRSRSGGRETFDVEDAGAVVLLGRRVVEAGQSAAPFKSQG